MTEREIRQLAEDHWEFIGKMLTKENEDGLIRVETVHFLYVEAMVHGAKHEREAKEGGGDDTRRD